MAKLSPNFLYVEGLCLAIRKIKKNNSVRCSVVLNDVLIEGNALGYDCFSNEMLRKTQVYGPGRD